MDNEIDIKIYVTAILFLLVQNRQQTHDWTLIGSGANGLGIQEWYFVKTPVFIFIWKVNNAEKRFGIDSDILNNPE